MINLSSYREFCNNKTTLKNTSLDTSQDICMTNLDALVVNFDGVKNDYISNLNLRGTPKSNDAIFSDDKGNIFFVEFKNGKIKKEYELRKKIYDSILIFTDITSSKISVMREYANYILIYNEQANKEVISEKSQEGHKNIEQPVESFEKFVDQVFQYSGGKKVRFGVEIFKGYCFKEVHTFTEKEFAQYISEVNIVV